MWTTKQAQSLGDLLAPVSERGGSFTYAVQLTGLGDGAEDALGQLIRKARDTGSLAEERIEEVLRKLFVIGTGEWVIIHCPEGAFGLSRNGTYAVERSKKLPKGYKVGSVGAGDAFCAGVLLAAYRGLSIGDALVYGNASAQVSLRHASASGGMVGIDEALAEYRRF